MNDPLEQNLRELKAITDRIAQNVPASMIMRIMDDDELRDLYTDLDERELRIAIVSMTKLAAFAQLRLMEIYGIEIPEEMQPFTLNHFARLAAASAKADLT